MYFKPSSISQGLLVYRLIFNSGDASKLIWGLSLITLISLTTLSPPPGLPSEESLKLTLGLPSINSFRLTLGLPSEPSLPVS